MGDSPVKLKETVSPLSHFTAKCSPYRPSTAGVNVTYTNQPLTFRHTSPSCVIGQQV